MQTLGDVQSGYSEDWSREEEICCLKYGWYMIRGHVA